MRLQVPSVAPIGPPPVQFFVRAAMYVPNQCLLGKGRLQDASQRCIRWVARAQDAALAASGERARLTAALGAMRAEMEAAAAIMARERRDAAAERANARRQIKRLAEQNGALLELSNALHAGLDARARAPPDQAHAPVAPLQAPTDCPAGALVAARLDRLEAALAERPACAGTGAGGHPGCDDCGGGAAALQLQGNAVEAPAQAGAAARPGPDVSGLLVEGCEAQLAATAPRRTVILQVTVRPSACLECSRPCTCRVECSRVHAHYFMRS